MRILGIIPARYNSSRFPGKPLIDLKGQTMIQRVTEGAAKSNLLSDLIVATDDERIASEVNRFGGKVVLAKWEVAVREGVSGLVVCWFSLKMWCF